MIWMLLVVSLAVDEAGNIVILEITLKSTSVSSQKYDYLIPIPYTFYKYADMGDR